MQCSSHSERERLFKQEEKQHGDQEYYKMLDSDPAEFHEKLVDQTNDWFKRNKTLTEKTAEGLEIANPRTPKFYTTPRFHKSGNPRRPVVSLRYSPTPQISEFVDVRLQRNCNWNSILCQRNKSLCQSNKNHQ